MIPECFPSTSRQYDTMHYGFSLSLSLSLVALVIPHFDYCDVVYNDASPDLIKKLQRAHNACVRYICNLKFADHVSPSFSYISWPRLKDRRTLHSLCLLHRILHSSSPAYLFSRFNYLSTHHSRETRGHASNQLVLPIHRTAIYDNSFTVSAAREWNRTPSSVRDLTKLRSFRQAAQKLF